MLKVHFRLENATALCGTHAQAIDERWPMITCQTCLKKRSAYEMAQAELRAFKNTQEVVITMVVPLVDWEELVTQLARAQRIHEIVGGMQPALSMLIARLKNADIVTRPAVEGANDSAA